MDKQFKVAPHGSIGCNGDALLPNTVLTEAHLAHLPKRMIEFHIQQGNLIDASEPDSPTLYGVVNKPMPALPSSTSDDADKADDFLKSKANSETANVEDPAMNLDDFEDDTPVNEEVQKSDSPLSCFNYDPKSLKTKTKPQVKNLLHEVCQDNDQMDHFVEDASKQDMILILSQHHKAE